MAESQAAAAPAAQPRRWPGLLPLIAAILEFLGGLGALPILATLMRFPDQESAARSSSRRSSCVPSWHAVTLFFLVRGNLPGALVSMAIVILVGWISYLPSIQLYGLELQGDGAGGLFTVALVILPPILVLAIAALALTGKRLTLATILALLPTLISILSVVAFGIGVAIYGF